jgi:protein-disulfide isomerase
MASRREQKEQVRATRIAVAQTARAAAVRRQRVWVFGGIVAVSAAVVVVVAVVSSGGGGTGLQPKPKAAATYRQVERSLSGIPQSGERLGDRSAKVSMTYVGDLECPICREFTESVLPQFIASYVRTAHVRITYRSLCTATCGVNTSRFVPQQVAAYAAGKQNLFWQYAELFYREQGEETEPYVTEQYLRGLASQIPNLDSKKWLADRHDPGLASHLQSDQALVTRLRLPAQTPEVLMSGPKGSESVPANEFPSTAWLDAAVKAVS